MAGHQHPKGKKKPTREERREANRLAQAKATLQAQAHADNPLQPQENRPALGSTPEGQLIPQEERRHRSKEKHAIAKEAGHPLAGPGRPGEYTDEEGDTICAWVQAGGSMRGYCKKTGRAPATLYRWMRESAQFHARFAQAHEDRADTLAEEGLEIVDDAALTPTIEGVAAAKLRWEARKWIASKLRPQKWGDKQMVEHVGAVNIRIGIPAKPGATAQLTHSSDDIIDV